MKYRLTQDSLRELNTKIKILESGVYRVEQMAGRYIGQQWILGKNRSNGKTKYIRMVKLYLPIEDSGEIDLFDIPLNKLMWIYHNGNYPHDCGIKFKDGNPMNCSIENLELEHRIN